MSKSEYFVWYKKKVLGPFPKMNDKIVKACKEIVDEGSLEDLEDTPPLNEDMVNRPNDVHIIKREIPKKKGDE